MIVPAGKKIDWAPRDDKLTKTASTENAEDINPLYEAAKSFFDTQKKQAAAEEKAEEKKCEKCGSTPCTCDKAKLDDKAPEIKTEAPEAPKAEVSVSADASSIANAVKKVEEKAEAAEAKIEQVEKAIDAVSDAAAAAKEIVAVIGDEEIEIEVEVDEGTEDGIGDKGEKEVGEDIIVESEPEIDAAACGTMASNKGATKKAKEVAMDKSAATEEQFCRYSMISAPNRKKLLDYWVNQLGYPKDYVKLMVKDSEK